MFGDARTADRRGGRRACGSAIKAEEKGERRRARGKPSARRRARRRAGRPARADPRAEAAAKAGKVGFDWNDPRAVLAKIREEADEIEAELDAGDATRPRPRSATCCSPWSISRAISTPIRRRRCARTNAKFERRFRLDRDARWPRAARRPQDATLAEMDALWDEAKSGGEIAGVTAAACVTRLARVGMKLGATCAALLGLRRIDPHRHAPSGRPRRALCPSPRCGGAASSRPRRRPDRARDRAPRGRAASRASIAVVKRVDALARSAPTPAPAAAPRAAARRGCRSRARPSASSRSILFQTSISRSLARRDRCRAARSTSSTSCDCASVSSCETSRTCRMTSASITSSSVARKAATSMVGRSEMKPTVSDRMIARAVRQIDRAQASDRASRTACRLRQHARAASGG